MGIRVGPSDVPTGAESDVFVPDKPEMRQLSGGRRFDVEVSRLDLLEARVSALEGEREGLEAYCVRRAQEIRDELASGVPTSGYRAQELGVARALDEMALWARGRRDA